MAHSHAAFTPSASFGRARFSIVGTFSAMIITLVQRVKNRRAMLRIQDLDDRMLEDMGISFSDVRAARAVPFWEDPTRQLTHIRNHRRDFRAGRRTR